MQVERALEAETPEQICARVFCDIRPGAQLPRVAVEFARFANANSFIRMDGGTLRVRITDALETAPAPVLEALFWILLSKLYRRPVPRIYRHRYRLFLNRGDMRRSLQQLRRARGRKFLSGPKGLTYDLIEVFEAINLRFFHGLMARPDLGWSRTPSRSILGHYDPSHHAIIISRLLDMPGVPRLALEYVMYHEMLHLKFPVETRGVRRCVHTPEFKAAEREFPKLDEAKRCLESVCAARLFDY